LQFAGLMTIPPFTDDPEGARPYFKRLRGLRDQVAARRLPGIAMDVLSMGMSHDFEIAIEEGSTCVRVGTSIFGERTRRLARIKPGFQLISLASWTFHEKRTLRIHGSG